MSTGDRNLSRHSEGNGRVLLVLFFFLTRSSESKQELQHYRVADPLQNIAAQYCNAATSKVLKHCQIYTVPRNSCIEASASFAQHPQCAQTQKQHLYSEYTKETWFEISSCRLQLLPGEVICSEKAEELFPCGTCSRHCIPLHPKNRASQT